MKRLIFFPILFFIFIACNPWPQIYAVHPETGQYEWWQGGSLPGQVFASKANGQFVLNKYTEQEGTTLIGEAFSVLGATMIDGAGSKTPCLCFRKTANSSWQVMKADGEVVIGEEVGLEKLQGSFKVEGAEIFF